MSDRGAVAWTASTGRRCSQRKPGAGRAGGACRPPHSPRRSLEAASETTGTAELVRGRTEAGPAPSPAPGQAPPQVQAPPPGRNSRGNLSFQPLSACLCPPSVHLLICLSLSLSPLICRLSARRWKIQRRILSPAHNELAMYWSRWSCPQPAVTQSKCRQYRTRGAHQVR